MPVNMGVQLLLPREYASEHGSPTTATSWVCQWTWESNYCYLVSMLVNMGVQLLPPREYAGEHGSPTTATSCNQLFANINLARLQGNAMPTLHSNCQENNSGIS